MDNISSRKIPCTVGILTFNSENGLGKCLESIKDFAEIIIADGGSTDRTLDIAKKYGAKVISQTNPGHPIEDFSKERQQLLDSSRFDWFFYLDSDEIATPELVSTISEIAFSGKEDVLVYKVKYQLSTPDFSIRYISFKPYYQTRFFNKKSKAFFIKKIHERIDFSPEIKVGVINEPWLVPLDDQLDFKVYKKKVHFRLRILALDWKDKSIFTTLVKGIGSQIVYFIKQLIRMVVLRIREKSQVIVPFRYECYRLYSNVFMIYLYILNIKNTIKKKFSFYIKQTDAQWEHQFKKGIWDFLVLKPQENLDLVACLCDSFIEKGSQSILDIACGNGGVLLRMKKTPFKYVGIDNSQTALNSFSEHLNSSLKPATNLICTNVLKQGVLQNQTFDVIIFSEIFYYVSPFKLLKTYKENITDKSYIIISMYSSWRSFFIWLFLRWHIKNIDVYSVSSAKKRNHWKVVVGKLKTR